MLQKAHVAPVGEASCKTVDQSKTRRFDEYAQERDLRAAKPVREVAEGDTGQDERRRDGPAHHHHPGERRHAQHDHDDRGYLREHGQLRRVPSTDAVRPSVGTLGPPRVYRNRGRRQLNPPGS